MLMEYSKIVLIALLYLIFLLAVPTYGEMESSVISSEDKASDHSAPMRELLLMEEIPVVVVTPARVAQPILESPSTITVITREDIRRYGVTSLSDLFRNVPGVDVMSVSPSGRNISMRGLNETATSRILSLIDGAAVYFDFYGITMWELLPVSIDEIERIEIVRGPGSALYGANAFDGVVNIITNSEDIGAQITAKIDHLGKLSGSISHKGESENFGYSASGIWKTISGWNNRDEDTGENKVFSGRLQYSFEDTSALNLYGSIQDSLGDLGTVSDTTPRSQDAMTYYVKMDYLRSNLKAHAYWRRFTGNAEYEDSSSYWIGNNALDISLQHSFRLLDSNLITWGLDYRFNQLSADGIDSGHSQNLLAGYFQDQFRLTRSITLTAGLRYDIHPLTGNNFSPRGSITYLPIKGHAFRLSAGRAFRNPSYIHSYLYLDYEMPVSIIPNPIDVKFRGNRDLDPEWVTSFEFGYHGTFGGRFSGGIDIFYNKINGLIDFTHNEFYSENALFPGSPGGAVPASIFPTNNRDAEAFGAEMYANFSITRYLSAYANYSYQHRNELRTEQKIKSNPTHNPAHKINPGLYAKIGYDLTFSLFANYVGKAAWGDKELDSYTILNSVVCYRKKTFEIGLSINNLLNNRHLEHPEGSEIGRTVIISLKRQIY